MTDITQRNIIRDITQVLFAHVCPLKISGFSFRDFVQTTKSTIFGFSQSAVNPVMLCAIRGFTALPKIIIGVSVRKAVALFGTILSFCGSSFETFSANLARDNWNEGLTFVSANSRTVQSATARRGEKGFSTLFAYMLNRHRGMLSQSLFNFKRVQLIA